MSKPFVDFLWGDPIPLGEHQLNGFAEPMAVFRPKFLRPRKPS
jgi:adenylate cyclase